MDQGIRWITAGSWRWSAAILAIGVLVSSLAIANGRVSARAADPYNTGPYLNPLAGVSNLTPARIDQGVDYFGSGPIYAIGDGVIDKIYDSGWPNGVFIAYHLTDGMAYPGYEVYVAECINPISWLYVGATVDAYTQIGTLYNCSDPNCSGTCGIETGWADPNNLGRALGYSQWDGADPTAYGNNFNQLLVALGAPGGILYGSIRGSLPGGWPTSSTGFTCSAKSGTQFWRINTKTTTVDVIFQGQDLGYENTTVALDRIVAPDLTWCFQLSAVLSWADGHQPAPTGSFDLNVRVDCNGSGEGMGWAFEHSYTQSVGYVNTGWWPDNGPCNTSWGVDNAYGSFGSQVEDYYGYKVNYGIPTFHATYLTYGTL